jgi:hypothetical protein
MFSSRERAEKRAAAAKNMGLQPEIGERKFPGIDADGVTKARPGTTVASAPRVPQGCSSSESEGNGSFDDLLGVVLTQVCLEGRCPPR